MTNVLFLLMGGTLLSLCYIDRLNKYDDENTFIEKNSPPPPPPPLSSLFQTEYAKSSFRSILLPSRITACPFRKNGRNYLSFYETFITIMDDAFVQLSTLGFLTAITKLIKILGRLVSQELRAFLTTSMLSAKAKTFLVNAVSGIIIALFVVKILKETISTIYYVSRLFKICIGGARTIVKLCKSRLAYVYCKLCFPKHPNKIICQATPLPSFSYRQIFPQNDRSYDEQCYSELNRHSLPSLQPVTVEEGYDYDDNNYYYDDDDDSDDDKKNSNEVRKLMFLKQLLLQNERVL